MAQIYIHYTLQKVKDIYGNALYDYEQTIGERLEKLAQLLWTAYQNKNEFACVEINNYHPDFLGIKAAQLFTENLSFEDIQQTIASEHGYKSWEVVENLQDQKLDLDFEKAIDHLLNGNLEALQNAISNNPKLLSQTSQYGHQATLLHYVGSNGVELYRQQVPLNLPAITEFLFHAGADRNAKMKVYGGLFTTYELLVTSAPPVKAGVLNDMKKVFEE